MQKMGSYVICQLEQWWRLVSNIATFYFGDRYKCQTLWKCFVWRARQTFMGTNFCRRRVFKCAILGHFSFLFKWKVFIKKLRKKHFLTKIMQSIRKQSNSTSHKNSGFYRNGYWEGCSFNDSCKHRKPIKTRLLQSRSPLSYLVGI